MLGRRGRAAVWRAEGSGRQGVDLNQGGCRGNFWSRQFVPSHGEEGTCHIAANFQVTEIVSLYLFKLVSMQ